MSYATFGLLSAALVLASPALAQTTADTAVAAPAKSAPVAGSTISGVTVEGARPAVPKSCTSRDKDCIATVVAELKTRYPKELQHWCELVEYRAANTNMTMDQVNGLGTAYSPGQTSVYGRFAPPAVAKVACAVEKPKEKGRK
jgi:hypothetical protein